MGMTDKQFDAFIASLSRNLEAIEEELDIKHKVKSLKLEKLQKDLESQLKRP